MTGSGAAAAAGALREAAMRGEPDRYLAATLAPTEARHALVAIAAFAAELARIPATVSEPALGDIRLQWWRDVLEDGCRGGRSGHPVADAICDAARRHDLPSDLLMAMIDAREFDLSGALPQDDAGMAAYLEAAEGHPFRLAMRVLGAGEAEAGPVATDAALAYGIARALVRLPMLLHNGGFILPAHRLRQAGLDPARLKDSPAAPDSLKATALVGVAIGGRAREALAAVRGRWGVLTRRLRRSLLPLAMVEPYLRAQSGLRLPIEMADVPPLVRVLRIGAAHLTGRL